MNADKAAQELKVIRELMERPHAAMKINFCVWAAVFLAAFASAVICTRLRERRQNMPFWSAIKKRILLTILPPFVAGVGLTLVLVFRWHIGWGPNEWCLIPPIWMLFYGIALWQVGLLSPVEVRLLGCAFIAAGLASALMLQAHPYWSLGVSFGGFHLVYGTAVWIRHGG